MRHQSQSVSQSVSLLGIIQPAVIQGPKDTVLFTQHLNKSCIILSMWNTFYNVMASWSPQRNTWWVNRVTGSLWIHVRKLCVPFILQKLTSETFWLFVTPLQFNPQWVARRSGKTFHTRQLMEKGKGPIWWRFAYYNVANVKHINVLIVGSNKARWVLWKLWKSKGLFCLLPVWCHWSALTPLKWRCERPKWVKYPAGCFEVLNWSGSDLTVFNGFAGLSVFMWMDCWNPNDATGYSESFSLCKDSNGVFWSSGRMLIKRNAVAKENHPFKLSTLNCVMFLYAHTHDLRWLR